MASRLGKFTQAPVERKDYSIDYSQWLSQGETLSTATFAVVAEGFVTPAVSPLVVDAYQVNPTAISFWVKNGDDGETYKVTVTIVTNLGQTKEDLVVFVVRAL